MSLGIRKYLDHIPVDFSSWSANRRWLTYKDLFQSAKEISYLACLKISFSSVNSDCRVIVFPGNISFHEGFDECQIPVVYIYITRVCLNGCPVITHLESFWFLRAQGVCAEESVNPFGVLVSFGPVCQTFRVKGSINTVFLQVINCLLRPLSLI